MELFIQPAVQLEKVAAEVDLPEDPNAWPKEVLDELFKQVPYIADFRPHVVMSRVDGERGYGFGHVEISNQSEAQMGTDPSSLASAGVRTVRLPVVIKNGKLSPFDLLVNDKSKVVPLTEPRLRQAIFRPQAFDVTSQTPGDQSMIGQLYPPYRQNMGFAGGGVVMPAGGMGKNSSAFEEFLIADLEKNDPGFRKVKTAEEHVKFRRDGKTVAEGSYDTVMRALDPRKKEPTVSDLQKAKGKTNTVSDYLRQKAGKKGMGRSAKVGLGLAAGTALAGGGYAAYKHFKGKEKKGSVLAAILPTIGPRALNQFWGELEKDAGLRAAFSKNKYAAAQVFQLLANHDPMSTEKVASAIPAYIHPTVVQVVRLDDSYMVKSASHHFWRPGKEIIGRGDLVQRFGEKVAFAVDTSGCVTMADHARTKDIEKRAEYETVSQPGVYKVTDSEGKELVGYVIPNLLDTDGESLPLAMFTNGSQSTIQDEILGEGVSAGVNLPEGPIGGPGFFYTIDQDGQIQATIPMALEGSHQMGGEPANFVGETYDGRPVELSVQPNIQELTPMEEGKLLVPEHWRWCSMANSQSVALAGGEEEANIDGEAEEAPPEPNEEEVKESSAYVTARASGDSFSLSGPGVAKLASVEKEFVDFDQAMFVLAGLGVEMGYGATKLAHAMTNAFPERIRIGRFITLAEEQEKVAHDSAATKLAGAPSLRRNLIKEAAMIPDPTAVDTVLSLGFINPENIMTFISYLPAIDDAQMKMCELLLSARLGLQDVSATALERAVRSTEEVIESLKVIAFQSQ